MKKFAVVFVVVVFAVTSLAFAADPPYRGRDRNRGQICSAVLEGEIVTITGIMAIMGYHQCMVVETSDKTQVKICGIGPNWYWEANNIDKPDIGESVIVDAFAVPFADATRYIAATITVGENDPQTIGLRDLTTGCPLWRNFDHH